MGKLQQQTFLKLTLECQFGDLKLSHNFLYMPGCPVHLLGRDLLCKLHAQMTFSPEKQQLYLQVPSGHALRLQMFLVEAEGPEKELFHRETYEQVKIVWADGTQGVGS